MQIRAEADVGFFCGKAVIPWIGNGKVKTHGIRGQLFNEDRVTNTGKLSVGRKGVLSYKTVKGKEGKEGKNDEKLKVFG